MFDSYDNAPEEIAEVCNTFLQQEYQRLYQEMIIQCEETGSQPEDVVLDQRAILETHIQTLRETMPNELTVFSKFKISQQLSDEQAIKMFKKRFEKTIPIDCVDLVLVHGLQEPTRGQTPAPEQETEMRNTTLSQQVGIVKK